jgi:transposase
MARSKDTTVLSVMHGICCGLDIHKESISACLVSTGIHGEENCELEVFIPVRDFFRNLL